MEDPLVGMEELMDVDGFALTLQVFIEDAERRCRGDGEGEFKVRYTDLYALNTLR